MRDKIITENELDFEDEPECVRRLVSLMAMAAREVQAKNLARNHTIDPEKLKIAKEIYDGVKDAFLDIDLIDVELIKVPSLNYLSVKATTTVVEFEKDIVKKFGELILKSDGVEIYPTNDDFMCTVFMVRSAYLESREPDAKSYW